MTDDDHAVILKAASMIESGLDNIAYAIIQKANATADVANALSSISSELLGIGQEIGWGLDPNDDRKAHLSGGN